MSTNVATGSLYRHASGSRQDGSTPHTLWLNPVVATLEECTIDEAISAAHPVGPRVVDPTSAANVIPHAVHVVSASCWKWHKTRSPLGAVQKAAHLRINKCRSHAKYDLTVASCSAAR